MWGVWSRSRRRFPLIQDQILTTVTLEMLKMNWSQWLDLKRRRGGGSMGRSKLPVTSYCNVAMIRLADICAAVTCDEGERSAEEKTPCYIQSKFGACPWP